MWEAGTLLLHGGATFLWARALFGRTSRVEFLLGFYLIVTLLVVAGGQALSWLHLFGEIRAWFAFQFVALSITLVVGSIHPSLRAAMFQPLRWGGFSLRLEGIRWREGRGLLLAGAVLAGAAILAIQLFLVTAIAPRNWDSLTCHLARMGFYLQQGTLEPFPTSWGTLVIHPTGGVCLHAYAFLVSGRIDSCTQFVNWFSYVVSILAIFGTCRLLGCGRVPSAVAGGTFGLLTNCMLQAVSTQTDMQFAGWVAVAMFFLMHYRVHRRTGDLVAAAVATVLPLGVKASALLVLPALGLLLLYAVGTKAHRQRVRPVAVYSLSALTAFVILIAPLGYIGNIVRHGHPMGPADFRKLHSFDGRSIGAILHHGAVNIARYGLSFSRLDGQAATIGKKQTVYLQPLVEGCESLGIHVNDPEGCRIPIWPYYDCLVAPTTWEDTSWWGVLGVVLVWPCVWIGLLWPGMSLGARTLAAATILFFLTQCFSGPYDPWRGRYFIHGALFALPCVGIVLERCRPRLRWVLIALVLCLGLESGVSTTAIQLASIVRCQDRVAQLASGQPTLVEPIRKYEEAVPPGSKVALHLPGDLYLFPFFGARVDRELRSAVDLFHPQSPDFGDAEFLLFWGKFETTHDGDLPLGQDLYVRRLRPAAPLKNGGESTPRTAGLPAPEHR